MDIGKIKDQIRKLMCLGEDTAAFEGEAENALRFARRLMLRHNVTAQDMEEARGIHEAAADADAEEYGTADAYSVGANLSLWESTLSWAVAGLVGTVKHYRGGKGVRRTASGAVDLASNGRVRQATNVVFYGPAADCRDAAELLAEWSHVVAAMARLRYGGVFRGPGRSYAEGFCQALFGKVQKIRREERAMIERQEQDALATDETRSTALMVRNATQLMKAKRAKAEQWLAEEKDIKLGSARRRTGGLHHDEAYRSGRDDGRRADFSHNRRKMIK